MMVPAEEEYLRPLPTPKKMLGHWALTAFLVDRNNRYLLHPFDFLHLHYLHLCYALCEVVAKLLILKSWMLLLPGRM